MVDYQKLGNYVYYEKNYKDIPKYVKFLNKFIHLELWFTLEKHGSMEKL